MQKRASEQSKHYQTVFEPLPTKAEDGLYFDTRAVSLPYAEEIPKLHYHDRFELGICERGDGLFLAEGNFYALSQGDVIFLAPGQRHYSRSLDNSALCYCRFVYLKPDLLQRVLKTFPPSDAQALQKSIQGIPTVLHPAQAPHLTEWIDKIVEACRPGEPHALLNITLYLACMLLEAERTLTPSIEEESTREPLSVSHGISAAVSIAEHFSLFYHLSESCAELASACHLSESQLRRQFVRAYGISPIAYRNRLRCRIAKELLSNRQLTVSEIAQRIGYRAVADSCRAFRKEYGLSPTEYRKQHTQKP